MRDKGIQKSRRLVRRPFQPEKKNGAEAPRQAYSSAAIWALAARWSSDVPGSTVRS